MGLAGGLVKRVFSKSKSSGGNERNLVDKTRWSLSKLNFCGDDFDSVHAEVNDLGSFESSEATVTQPAAGVSDETVTLTSAETSWKEGEEEEEDAHEGTSSDHNKEQTSSEEGNSHGKSWREEDAALIIQSAFRGFLARKHYEEIKQTNKNEEVEALSRASLGTSVEVQAGDSVKNFTVQEENISIQHRVPHKVRTHTSRLKLQEDWDDSTLSSDTSKLRIQNRLEAMTRRERALAYAFAQQLRTCSAKKKQSRHDANEPNMGWNWLERWMATRLPENSMADDCLSKHLEPLPNDRRTVFFKRRFDLSLEEKESCGSNDVSVSYESSVAPSQSAREVYRPAKNRLKSPRNMPRRHNLSNYHYARPTSKVIKSLREAEKEKQQKQMQSSTINAGEIYS